MSKILFSLLVATVCNPFQWIMATLVNDSSMNSTSNELPAIHLDGILACQLLAMQGKNPLIRNTVSKFDTDSALIGVDNRCSACISDKVEDFEDLQDSGRIVRGIGGVKISGIKVGTLVW